VRIVSELLHNLDLALLDDVHHPTFVALAENVIAGLPATTKLARSLLSGSESIDDYFH